MSARLKFLHVTTFYPPYSFGGDGAYVYRLAHALADRGHEVDVLHSIDAYRLQQPTATPIEWPAHEGVRVHSLISRNRWLPTLVAHQTGRPYVQERQIDAVFNARPYDVIHFHNVSLFGPAILTKRPAHASPVTLYTTHEHWLICPTHVLWKFGERACERPQCLACTIRAGRPPQWWRYTDLLARASASVDAFLSPSAFTARMHAERGFARPVEVLPLFVDTDTIRTGGTMRPHARPYFLFVGRLEPLKGVDRLIRAMDEGPDADLVIAGDGSEAPRLRRIAATNPRVHLVGALPARSLDAWYEHAIACCIPSLTYEVFPTVALEALAHGTPVIAHDLGGLAEIVRDSGGGVLYRSEPELSAALHQMARDAALRMELGQRGRDAVAARWSRPAHLNAYFALLDRVRSHRAAAITG